MSYILDALKKADAEREQGSVPGLHSQPQASTPDEADDKAVPLPLAWVGAGVAIAVIAILSWMLWSREPAPASGQAGAPDNPSAQNRELDQHAQTTQPPPGGGTGTQAPNAATRMDGVKANAPAWSPTQAAPGGYDTGNTGPDQRRQAANRGATGRQRPLNGGPTNSGTANQGGGQASADAAGAAPATSLNELPDEIRRELPQMVVGGAMYADSPANRMIVVNSQVLHEGDQVAPGLQLEEIKLKSAVFKYKGYRYSIKY